MSELHQLVGDDSRGLLQRLSRHQLHKVATELGMQYPVGATSPAMIKLFEANNIDITQSKVVRWVTVAGQDVDGKHTQQSYPVSEQPASARNNVNAAGALDARMTAKEKEEKAFEEARLDVLERENAQLRRTNEQLQETLEQRLAALEDKEPAKKDSPADEYWALYRKARDLGLDVDRNMKQGQIEAMIAKAKDK